MPEISEIDNMICLLEAATEETDKLSPLNESSSNVIIRIGDLFTKLCGVTAEMSAMQIPQHEIDELRAKIYAIRRIHITDEYRVITYSKIHELQDNYSLNISCLFDYVLQEIKQHSANPDREFDPDLVNRKALSYALKQCTGKKPSEYLNLEGFKYHYQMSIFGGLTKVNIIPNGNKLSANALRIPLIIKYIDTKLIYRHITALNKYQSDLISEFESLQKQNSNFNKYLTKYLNATELAIRNTLNIYKIMRNAYYLLKTEYDRIFNFIIAKNRQLNESSLVESSLIQTAEFIRLSVKPLREISSQIGSLNESADQTIMQMSSETISESLNSFVLGLKERASKDAKQRYETRQKFLMKMGPVLNSISGKEINENLEYEAYENINSNQIEAKINELITQFDKNLAFLKDILEHCDKYRNQTVKFYIKQFLPSELHDCIPDVDINLIGVLLTNISSEICGTYRYINPDINRISQNVVSIPSFLGVIDSHINNIVSLVEESISKIDLSGASPDESKMVIDNITNAFFAYLAILLNIYMNLSIIEDSALCTVTAISDASESIPM